MTQEKKPSFKSRAIFTYVNFHDSQNKTKRKILYIYMIYMYERPLFLSNIPILHYQNFFVPKVKNTIFNNHFRGTSYRLRYLYDLPS